jgi:hypothetical protein
MVVHLRKPYVGKCSPQFCEFASKWVFQNLVKLPHLLGFMAKEPGERFIGKYVYKVTTSLVNYYSTSCLWSPLNYMKKFQNTVVCTKWRRGGKAHTRIHKPFSHRIFQTTFSFHIFEKRNMFCPSRIRWNFLAFLILQHHTASILQSVQAGGQTRLSSGPWNYVTETTNCWRTTGHTSKPGPTWRPNHYRNLQRPSISWTACP